MTIILDSEDELSAETHKKSLDKLKKIDPDFYDFLEANDENLLNFDVADEESDAEQQDDEDEKVHQPGALQGDSDESDFEVSYFRCHLFYISLFIDSGISFKINLYNNTDSIELITQRLYCICK